MGAALPGSTLPRPAGQRAQPARVRLPCREPPEGLQDRIHFVINNLSVTNLDSKAGELKDKVRPGAAGPGAGRGGGAAPAVCGERARGGAGQAAGPVAAPQHQQALPAHYTCWARV